MNHDWQQIPAPPADAAVFQIAPGDQDQLWLASPAGLFHKDGANWRVLSQNLLFSQPDALFVAGKIVIAAGLDVRQATSTAAQSNIFRSFDLGANWQAARVEQTASLVLNFTASPNFQQDGVILAGTDGDGILRSRDSGRTWQLSNFGLRNFSIGCMLAARTWSRREPVFAGTENGFYFSPNGGRAWKYSGLEGQIVLSLGLLQTSDSGFTLFAGLENNGFYRSIDSGQSWEKVDLGLSGDQTVNAICVGQNGVILLGVGEYGLICSTDGGIHWKQVENSPSLVISLAEWNGRFYAGTAEDGLWLSDERTPHGSFWQRV